MKLDPFYEDLLRILDQLLYSLMLRFLDPVSLLLLFFGEEGLPKLIDAVLARQYVMITTR